MAGRSRGLPLAVLRQALERWVEKTSLRQAARETGMSPTGLRKVLSGSRVHASTERKLLTWYLRHLAQQGDWGALDADTAAAALALLTEGLLPGTRRALVSTFLERIEKAYRDAGQVVPAWVQTLRSELPEAE
ncbi:MAG: hypothetical protein ABW277_23840 [Longimicrobiaceae bacterium]|jgi:hypothetical protein